MPRWHLHSESLYQSEKKPAVVNKKNMNTNKNKLLNTA